MAEATWRLHWEADLAADDHVWLGALLAKIYPDHAATFRERSYSGARPEGRIVGYAGDSPIAHLGFLRRTLRTGEASVLVGDVGLVGVDPDHRGGGHGRRLLAEATATFDRLALPFGFLTCRPAVVPFYERGGWHRVAGQVTRMIDNAGRPETYTGPALVLPVRSPIHAWPAGPVVRDGLEV